MHRRFLGKWKVHYRVMCSLSSERGRAVAAAPPPPVSSIFNTRRGSSGRTACNKKKENGAGLCFPPSLIYARAGAGTILWCRGAALHLHPFFWMMRGSSSCLSLVCPHGAAERKFPAVLPSGWNCYGTLS